MTLLLKPFKKIIDDALEQEFREKEKLQMAMRYILLSGGKRFRPVITMLVADAIGKGLPVLQSAISVEFSHTASLIADDLPCMDDETERRGKKCLHTEFGEATAMLASYAFIAESHGRVERNAQELKGLCDDPFERMALAVSIGSRLSGHLGITLGQQLDLFEKPDSMESLEHLIYLKTTTLFEAAMSFGWIFGGGDLEKMDQVKEAASFFGTAFQVRDDLKDFEEDLERGCTSNFAVMLGRDKAKGYFSEKIALLKEKLKQLNIYSDSFVSIVSLLEKY